MEEKRATFLKQYGYPRRKRAKKEGVSRPRLDPFFFFLTMYLIGWQKKLCGRSLAENQFIRGFV